MQHHRFSVEDEEIDYDADGGYEPNLRPHELWMAFQKACWNENVDPRKVPEVWFQFLAPIERRDPFSLPSGTYRDLMRDGRVTFVTEHRREPGGQYRFTIERVADATTPGQ
jgi:hypothetical protein